MRRTRVPRPGSAGFSLLEILIGGAVFSVAMVVGVSSFLSISRASTEGIQQQEVTRTGSRIVDALGQALETADASTIVFSDAAPDRLSFQQVLGYDPATSQRVLSRQLTIRTVMLSGDVRAIELTRAESALEGETVIVCLPPNVTVGLLGPIVGAVTDLVSVNVGFGLGGLLGVNVDLDGDEDDVVTATVLSTQLPLYLAAGATLGACGSEPTPASGPPPVILGSGLAGQDADDGTLPPLHFTVQTEDNRTVIRAAFTLQTGTATRRFERCVAIQNP